MADPITGVDVVGAIAPFLAALVAVSGVVLTLIYTNKRERDRQEREIEERRWSTLRDERRKVYTEFLSRWESYLSAEKRAPQRSRSLHELDENVLQRVLEREEAYWDLQRAFNALSLIAPEEVRAAAAGMLEQEEVERGREEGPSGRYWTAVRKDLRIPD